MIDVPVVLAEGASLPEYATAGAAGADLRSTIGFDLAPGERRLVPTGIRMALPEGYEAQIRPRSGLALRHGIAMVNAPGTIDPDYRGEIGVLLINLGVDVVTFVPGDRIGQMVVCPVVRARFGETTSLDGTVRGEGGFGSTGTD